MVMTLECETGGNLIVDPALLSARLALGVEELQRRMRLGLVTSLIEDGVEADDGRRRLTVRSGNRIWRAIVDAQHELVSEEILDLTTGSHLKT